MGTPQTTKARRLASTLAVEQRRLVTANATINRNTGGGRSSKEHLADFATPPDIGLVEQLLPFCPWAHRYVTIASQLGSMCTWKPYYRGQPATSVFMEALIGRIKPAYQTQTQMREQALRLQRSVGQHAIIATGNSDSTASYAVAHPDALRKAKQNDTEKWFAYATRPAAKAGDAGWVEYPVERLTRHHIPDPVWPDLPASDLTAVVHLMQTYCDVVEAAQATVQQRKISSNLLHVKLDERQVSEWGDPDDADGEDGQTVEEETLTSLYETWRKGYEQGGIPRIAPHLLWWQGSVDHIDLGEIFPTETVAGLQALSQRAVEGLPIPNVWLLDGIGTTNHWGDAEVRRELHTQAVYPELETHDRAFTEHCFWPMIRSVLESPEHRTVLEGGIDVEGWELRSDRSLIDVKSDNTGQMIDLFKCGLVSREGLVRHVPELDESDLLDLGSIPETEFLLQTLGRNNGASSSGTAEGPAAPVTASPGLLALLG